MLRSTIYVTFPLVPIGHLCQSMALVSKKQDRQQRPSPPSQPLAPKGKSAPESVQLVHTARADRPQRSMSRPSNLRYPCTGVHRSCAGLWTSRQRRGGLRNLTLEATARCQMVESAGSRCILRARATRRRRRFVLPKLLYPSRLPPISGQISECFKQVLVCLEGYGSSENIERLTSPLLLVRTKGAPQQQVFSYCSAAARTPRSPSRVGQCFAAS